MSEPTRPHRALCHTDPALWGMLKAARFRRIIDLMERRFEEWDKDLTLVRAAARDVSVAELSLRHRVAVARRSGHSWAAIGVVLGISEQAAQERFGRYGEETA